MKLLSWTAIVLAASGALFLSACSTPKGPGPGGAMSPDGMGGGVQSYGTDQAGFKLDASGRRINPLYAPASQSYYFDYDSNNISPSDTQAMNIQASYLVAHPNARIRLEGNTDNRGSREYNIGLGWRRDQSVARYFEQQGVRASQIQMVSYGKERPIAFGNNEHDWSLNRRVDLKYTRTN